MKKINLKSILLCLLAASLCNCGNDDFTGSDTLITVTRELPDFSRIEAGAVIDVRVSFGQTQVVEVTVNDNLEDQLKTEVSNGVLNISLEQGSFDNATFIVEILVPNLEGLRLRGSSQATVRYNNSVLDLNVSGSAKVAMQGSTDVFNVDVAGSAEIGGFPFMADVANVDLSGAATLELTATGTINGSVSGAAELRYKGMPTVNVQTSGAGRVVNAN